MQSLIEIDKYPIKDALPVLLQDKTTKKNIIFATDAYEEFGINHKMEITVENLQSIELQPRALKTAQEQSERTKKKAEVFTPSWICNKMNNFCDSEWFDRDGVFNVENGENWTVSNNKIEFTKSKLWEKYVDSRRLEITCGEAPYIVSIYDTTNAEIIPVKERIGILDRKLRIVNENTDNEADWLKWTFRAFQSVYGYEFQGDNLLIARINLLLTFVDYMNDRWDRVPKIREIKKISNIIAWNLWQMDGLDTSCEEENSFSLFDDDVSDENQNVISKIYNWRSKFSFNFKDLKKGTVMKKKLFDFCIGNPPYQEETVGEQKQFAPPVYDKFMEAAYKVADKVELITPARFLFNVGSTPKPWNKKMLEDEHLKVLHYEQDSSNIFSNTDIMGGVVITYRDNKRKFEKIGTFSAFAELNSIRKKVTNYVDFKTLSDIVLTRTAYRLTDKMHKDNPNAINQLSEGHAYDMSTNIFDRLPQIFFDDKPKDGFKYIQIFGKLGNNRVYKWVRKDYVNNPKPLDKYKVILPKSNGSGAIGEVLCTSLIGTPLIGTPSVGTTETFINVGAFDSLIEAEACLKYIKSKFARTMLGILKITQDNPPATWKYVPLQDFTTASDIDWSVSVAEIDKQLYKKYGLSREEIDFIETHVKEME